MLGCQPDKHALNVSLQLNGKLQKYFTGRKVKIIGMGWAGAEFFLKIAPDSVMACHIAHGFDTSVALDAKAPHDLTAGLPMEKPTRLYDENVKPTDNNVAVYDAGSLPLQGAQGIARVVSESKCRGRHWPITKQGNYILWGYGESNAQRLTDDGKQLFINLVKNA